MAGQQEQGTGVEPERPDRVAEVPEAEERHETGGDEDRRPIPVAEHEAQGRIGEPCDDDRDDERQPELVRADLAQVLAVQEQDRVGSDKQGMDGKAGQSHGSRF